MAKENGFWVIIKKFQVLIWLVVAVIGVVGFFLSMGSDIDHNTEDIAANVVEIEVNSKETRQNREDIIRLQGDVTHIKGAVDRIEKKL